MLGGATLVGWLGENIAALVPFRIVRSYQRGVRFWLGAEGREVEPGFWWIVPGLLTLELVDTRADTTNLPTQSVTTSDGKSVTFSANVEFSITDPVAYVIGVQQFDTSLTNVAMSHLAKRVRAWTWDELVTEQRALELSLRDTMTTRAKKWGVTIHDVGITDLTCARTLRFYGDPLIS
ncbi:MAG: SPFH domain-containing protein [Acidimicrobiia bacterium]|nr:MAG: SPFH domain-containing protein [Acidimicrobiia bacterium]